MASIYLEEGIEGDPEEEDVGEDLDQREGGVDHPVRQPFGVVIFLCALDGFQSVQKQRQDQLDQKMRSYEAMIYYHIILHVL